MAQVTPEQKVAVHGLIEALRPLTNIGQTITPLQMLGTIVPETVVNTSILASDIFKARDAVVAALAAGLIGEEVVE